MGACGYYKKRKGVFLELHNKSLPAKYAYLHCHYTVSIPTIPLIIHTYFFAKAFSQQIVLNGAGSQSGVPNYKRKLDLNIVKDLLPQSRIEW